MYSCQEFSLVTSSTSLSPSRFALPSSLHLSLSLSTTPFSPTSTSTLFLPLAPFFHSFLLLFAVLESRVAFLFHPIS